MSSGDYFLTTYCLTPLLPQLVSSFYHGRDEIYLPWFWRWIMRIIRHIPESVFKRLKL
ncbi:MAG: hypothetical protein ACOYMW_00505 [Candidatus Competibacteraceae bacterium]